MPEASAMILPILTYAHILTTKIDLRILGLLTKAKNIGCIYVIYQENASNKHYVIYKKYKHFCMVLFISSLFEWSY